jgi:hypothetical protein
MQTYTVTVDELGTTRWHNSQGQLHRELGPAIEHTNGSRAWYVNDQLHRTDGPALEYANGSREWYVNDQLHRTDGPAVEDENGDREWYQNGDLHRLDGPAVEYAEGDRFWYVNGKELTKAEFEAQQTKELTVAEVEELLGHRVKIIG